MELTARGVGQLGRLDSRTPVAKEDPQRKKTKNAEVPFFALFAPLRCALTPRLRGVLRKMAVNFHCQTRYGNREKTHESSGLAPIPFHESS
jgi:hypothetical protein